MKRRSQKSAKHVADGQLKYVKKWLLAFSDHQIDQFDVSVAVHALAGELFLEGSTLCVIPLLRCDAEVNLEVWLEEVDADKHLVGVRVNRAYGDVTWSIFQSHRH